MHVNHCVVDYLTCPWLCATQNHEVHKEVPSAERSWSRCMVYIPFQQPLPCLHVLLGSRQYLLGTIIANSPKCNTRGKKHVLQTMCDPMYEKTLRFGFLGPPLVRGLKQFLTGKAGEVHATTFLGTPQRW